MCTPPMIQRYVAKISGPLLDRIDIHIEVPAVQYKELRGGAAAEGSAEIRERVMAARERQRERFQTARREDLFECADDDAADSRVLRTGRRMRSGCWSGRCSSRG